MHREQKKLNALVSYNLPKLYCNCQCIGEPNEFKYSLSHVNACNLFRQGSDSYMGIMTINLINSMYCLVITVLAYFFFERH